MSCLFEKQVIGLPNRTAQKSQLTDIAKNLLTCETATFDVNLSPSAMLQDVSTLNISVSIDAWESVWNALSSVDVSR